MISQCGHVAPTQQHVLQYRQSDAILFHLNAAQRTACVRVGQQNALQDLFDAEQNRRPVRRGWHEQHQLRASFLLLELRRLPTLAKALQVH